MNDFPILDGDPLRTYALSLVKHRELTPKLMTLAGLYAKGWPLAKVARQVGISQSTARSYLSQRIYPVLGVKNQFELMRWWIENIEQRGHCGTCLLRMAHDAGTEAPCDSSC